MPAKPDANDGSVWQDREIRFDVPLSQLACRKGEFEIDCMSSVEDTKGNNGERGEIAITNLRMIWFQHRQRKTNLSIGYSSIVSLNIKHADSRLRGQTQALYVLTKFNGSRFEFIFTNLVRNSPRLFTTVQAVFRSYETTKLYRDLKLRGAIVKDGVLNLLPNEQVYNKIVGVSNLSSDQGNLGTFYLTNVRMVWHAKLAENFNVSIPYMQMKVIRMRDSKFGKALVIETVARSGGYILGFRIDPIGKLQDIFQEIKSLHELYSSNPVFGVEFVMEEKAKSLEELTVARKEDDIEIVGEGDHAGDAFAAYIAAGSNTAADRPPVFNPQLGLAIESLRDGFTLDNLWSAL